MKTTLCILVLGLLLSPRSITAQVAGNDRHNPPAPVAGNYQYEEKAKGNYEYDNYNYNYQQDYRNVNRNTTSIATVLSNTDITVNVSGLMNVAADNYVAVFNIVQVGATTEQTDELMNDRISRLKQELKKIGVDTTEIKTDMLSFVPKYEFQPEAKLFSKTYNELPSGFEMQKNVSVRFKNSADVDPIVTAAANAEIYDLTKVDYFIADLQKSLDSLRLRCLQEIKTKNKSYEVLGFKLDTLKKVISDNFVTTYPQTRYFSYKAFSRPSLNSIKKKAQVIYNEATGVNSRFYNQVDYDHYDLVVNPLVTEPVVQISYSVSVKYFLSEDKPKNNYYILSSTGDVHQFNPR